MSRDNIAKFDAATKIWIGPMGKHPYSLNTFVGELLIEKLNENPSRVIQINHDEGTEWIAKDLKLSSIRAAQNFAALGIKPDDVIGFNVENNEKVYPLVVGCILSGAIVNPLHVTFSKDGLKQMFQLTTPKIVICDADVYKTTMSALNELQSDAKIFTMVEKVPGVPFVDELLALTGIEDAFVPTKFDKKADKKAISVCCTSGTTGEPKGTLMSHASVLSWTCMVITPSPVAFKSFGFLPLYWISGIAGLINTIMNSQETRISTKKYFNIESLIEIVEKHKPSVLTIPPFCLTPFLNSPLSTTCDFSCVKVIGSVGSITNEDLRKKFKLTFPNIFLSTTYAMTECPCSVSFYGDPFDGLTVGKVATNIYLRVVDEDENNLGINEMGEIRLKSEFAFLGYYRNEKASQDAFDNEGFFKTGDIGYVDENATLYIVDRVNDIFRCDGFYISSTELENYISSIEGVQFVCVVGVPDKKAVALPAAVITKLPNYEHLSEEFIASSVRDHFPTAKHLHGGVYFVDQIPCTPIGKFKKKQVTDMATERFMLLSVTEGFIP